MIIVNTNKEWLDLSDIEQDKWIDSACMLKDRGYKGTESVYKLAEILYNKSIDNEKGEKDGL